jgi:hypothetical protein
MKHSQYECTIVEGLEDDQVISVSQIRIASPRSGCAT